MFIPYRTETVITRWPVANIAIIAICVVSFVLLMLGVFPQSLVHAMILNGWNPVGFLGSQFLHDGIGHLFFNMLFLWVFGNAVCETMGNWRYLGAYFLVGFISDAIHVICDGAPAIGASGAINGVVGFYLILFPTNKVDCFYWFWFRVGTVEVTGYWLVILWFLGDVLGAWLGDAGVAYWAHLGGLGAGIAAGVLYETRGWATLADYDNPSLITLIFRLKGPEVKKSYKTREELIREHFAQQPPSAEVPVEKPPDVFTVACPHCNQMLELRADMIGQTIQCPDCSGEMNVEE